jgi:hypothetical protein
MIASMQDLPPEVLAKILRHLSGIEIANAKLVCKEWYQIIVNFHEFIERTVLHITNVVLDMDKNLIQVK